MPHEITMPQLGMAQDSGVIAAWMKQPGDAVTAGDILMEVETDKATMEVEVGHDGFLAEIRAAAGVSVPVGQVIAIICDKAEDALPIQEARSNDGSTPENPPPPHDSPPVDKPTSIVPTPAPAGAPTSDRILASPKARIEAVRRGIDLRQLVRQGIAQPYHVADLDRVVSESAGHSEVPSELTIEVSCVAFAEFADWAKQESNGAVTDTRIWMSLVSGAWRRTVADSAVDAIVVKSVVMNAAIASLTVRDADLAGLSNTAESETAQDPNLLVYDFSGTAITAYRGGLPGAVPKLVLSAMPAQPVPGQSGEAPDCCKTAAKTGGYRITFQFDEHVLPLETAILFLNELAGRTSDPIRQLL